jgi:uncharacterized membrane protein YedE/YeeE
MMEGVPVFQALAGGVLIGLGATLLMLGDGRIAGIAGILGGAYGGAPGERAWRIVFLLGMAAGGLAAAAAGLAESAERTGYPLGLLIAAGLVGGFGARLGNGCTSGHGVCGMARLSKRSIVATVLFTATGFLTVAALRAVGVLS